MHITQNIPATGGVGPTGALTISHGPGSYAASIQVAILAGTPTYDIEVSNDGAAWAKLATALTTNYMGSLTTLGPPVYVRLNVTLDTGSASIKAVVHEVV
jgi:hypothetical protein